MDRLERALTSGLALLAAALGLAVARRGVSGSDDAWTSVALLVLGASYWTLAGVLAWHACAGVPAEGYLTGEHGWAIETRKWLARILLFPLLVLVPVGTRLRRRLVSRSIGIGPDSDDRVLDVVMGAAGNGLWALTDSAVYVGSPEAAFWRIPYSDIRSVSQAPLGPWARTELAVTVAGRVDPRNARGTFTHRNARNVLAHLERRAARAAHQ